MRQIANYTVFPFLFSGQHLLIKYRVITQLKMFESVGEIPKSNFRLGRYSH